MKTKSALCMSMTIAKKTKQIMQGWYRIKVVLRVLMRWPQRPSLRRCFLGKENTYESELASHGNALSRSILTETNRYKNLRQKSEWCVWEMKETCSGWSSVNAWKKVKDMVRNVMKSRSCNLGSAKGFCFHLNDLRSHWKVVSMSDTYSFGSSRSFWLLCR